VTGYLLDTNIALISLVTPERIPADVQRIMQRETCFLSVISYWEVTLKTMKGKLRVRDPQVWWPQTLERLSVTPLLFRPEHVSAVYTLPPIHQDPFDRALIAQAVAERLTIITTDSVMTQYGVDCLRVS